MNLDKEIVKKNTEVLRTKIKDGNTNLRYCTIEPSFFNALQHIRLTLDSWSGSINIIKKMRTRKTINKCSQIIGRMAKTYLIHCDTIENFIEFIDNNKDIFPPELFQVLHTEAGELCCKCHLKGYDHLDRLFTMYHHNKTLDMRLNLKTREITIKCNIVGTIGYTKQYKEKISASGTMDLYEETYQLIDIISNIIMVCSLCYIRGDYNAIERCFIPLQ